MGSLDLLGPAIRGLRPGHGMWRRTILAVVLAIAVSGGLRGQTERSSTPGSKALAEERRADELADLVAADLAVSQPFPLPGETVTITARVDNRAGEPARGVLLQVLADGRTVAEKRVDVAVRASYELRASWKAPRVAGMVTLALVVDPEGALSESDRSDNRRELEVAVAPKPPPGTELAVVSVERVAEPESQVRFVWWSRTEARRRPRHRWWSASTAGRWRRGSPGRWRRAKRR